MRSTFFGPFDYDCRFQLVASISTWLACWLLFKFILFIPLFVARRPIVHLTILLHYRFHSILLFALPLCYGVSLPAAALSLLTFRAGVEGEWVCAEQHAGEGMGIRSVAFASGGCD
jgi:hypothetical protein